MKLILCHFNLSYLYLSSDLWYHSSHGEECNTGEIEDWAPDVSMVQVSLNSFIPFFISKQKKPVFLWIIKQLYHVIPLNFVHSCTAQADVGVFLQKHLYQGLQREEGALR